MYGAISFLDSVIAIINPIVIIDNNNESKHKGDSFL